jgi:hypothetical protein
MKGQLTTYALRNITSVKMTIAPSLSGCAILVICFGAIFLLGVLLSLGDEDTEGLFTVFLFSVGIIAGGIYWLRNCKQTYNVVIVSSSSESNAVTSTNKAYIEKIVDSINDAIVSYQ